MIVKTESPTDALAALRKERESVTDWGDDWYLWSEKALALVDSIIRELEKRDA